MSTFYNLHVHDKKTTISELEQLIGKKCMVEGYSPFIYTIVEIKVQFGTWFVIESEIDKQRQIVPIKNVVLQSKL